MGNFARSKKKDSMSQFFNQISLSFREHFLAKKIPCLKKLKIGDREDVYLSAFVRDCRLNTNIKAYIGNLDEMSWGFMGSGPLTLALNILYTYTGDEKFARKNALEFRAEFLEKIDKTKSYWMPNFMIESWIVEKMEGDVKHV